MNRPTPYVRELIPKRRLTAPVMRVKKKRCIDNFMKYCEVPQHSTAQATAKRMGKSAFRLEPRLLASLLKETQPLERHRMGTTL